MKIYYINSISFIKKQKSDLNLRSEKIVLFWICDIILFYVYGFGFLLFCDDITEKFFKIFV